MKLPAALHDAMALRRVSNERKTARKAILSTSVNHAIEKHIKTLFLFSFTMFH